MCTVSYIPFDTNHFILTSNRDEKADRLPQCIEINGENGFDVAFPKDPRSGGSWIAISADNRVMCLLNGAFVKHLHKPPYKRSRGLMVLDFFRYATAYDFFDHYDFEGMEPFTTVIFDRKDLFEMRWDEERTHIQNLDASRAYLWSSSTLYDESVQRKRQRWFEAWQSRQSAIDLKSILDFHHNAGDGDPRNDVVINREGEIQTLSITSINKGPQAISMNYEDLLRKQFKQATIQLEKENVSCQYN